MRRAFPAAALVAMILTLPSLARADRFAVGTVPAAPEDGGLRDLAVAVSEGRLNMRSEASTTAPVTARLARHTVLSHLGCEAAEGRAWCDFGVARAGGGDTTLVITRAGGSPRVIFYRLGRPISADTSEADRAPFSSVRTSDNQDVSIGSERYTLPDTIVFGG